MRTHVISIAILTLAIVLLPSVLFAQDETPGMTGAGEATLPGGALLGGVSLTSLTFGTGVSIPGDGSAKGSFEATLTGSILGLSRKIEIIAHAATGSIDAGTGVFSGTATVDMGDGLPPLTDVPITVTATSDALVLVINSVSLPAANLTGGDLTIE